MMFTLKSIAVILVGSIGIMGCSTSRQVGVQSRTGAESSIASSNSSQSVAPLQNEDLQMLGPQYQNFWSDPSKVEVKPYALKTDGKFHKVMNAAGKRKKKTKGYRVQLFAGREQDRALDIKAAAESRFGISVYVVYEAPQYKVRAGNFVNRLEAAELMNSIKMDGFRDAWIVRSQIEFDQSIEHE